MPHVIYASCDTRFVTTELLQTHDEDVKSIFRKYFGDMKLCFYFNEYNINDDIVHRIFSNFGV